MCTFKYCCCVDFKKYIYTWEPVKRIVQKIKYVSVFVEDKLGVLIAGK